MVLCIRVERKKAEAARQALARQGLLDGSHVPAREGDFVFFPVKALPAGMKAAGRRLTRRAEFGKPLSLELEGKLTGKEMKELVKSFDIVGDIAVVEIPPALEKKQRLVAGALFRMHHSVKVVAKKTGGTAGEFRIRPVRVIAGERRTHTVYREAGCEFGLDLNRAYFSPRLGTERTRIAGLVKPRENVLVPFAGVGPFAIRIAKKEPSAQVVGIELNPDAAEYFKSNIERNRCGNATAVQGDVARLLPGKYLDWADRIAMPLPKGGTGFLPCTIPCLKKGGALHYYSFGDAKAPYMEAERRLKGAAEALCRRAKITFRRVVRPYSKTVVQVVVDARIF